MAVFSKLLSPLASAYGFQACKLVQLLHLVGASFDDFAIVCALIFVPQATEKYYDLCGALGYLSTTFVSLYYPAMRDKFYLGKPGPLPSITSFAPRQLLLSGCLAIWCTRLGIFLASVSSCGTHGCLRLIYCFGFIACDKGWWRFSL